MNLFIIGNGFDMAHRLKTSYEDFHDYLGQEYPNASGDEIVTPEAVLGPKGDLLYDQDIVVSYLLRLITNIEGNLWRDLENTLGVLDLSEHLDLYGFEDEENPWVEVRIREDIAGHLVEATRQIS